MYKRDFIVLEIKNDEKETRVLARRPTVIAAIYALVSYLISKHIVDDRCENAYDQLSRLEVDDLTYRLNDRDYKIQEVINNDFEIDNLF